MERPDPGKNIQDSVEYAKHYVASHMNSSDEFTYRLGYADLLLIDSIFHDSVMLDVGCGTGGYYALAHNYGRIDGMNFSSSMIDVANKLKTELNLEDVEFRCETFDTFMPSRQYDVVRMPGIYGWYVGWHGRMHVLDKVRGLLIAGGVAVLSFVDADTPVK